MGTNYYLMTKNKSFINTYFPDEYELTDTPEFGYEVHLGKRSLGWKPLFQTHEYAYHSVKEMLNFLREHNNQIKIYDEYDTYMDVKQLEEELINWGSNQTERMVEYPGLTEKIKTPIDHVEMTKRDPTMRGYKDSYYHDADGYDFCKNEFC